MTDTQQLTNDQLSIKVARLKGWRGVVRNLHGEGVRDATEQDYTEADPFKLWWWPPEESANAGAPQPLPAYAVSIEAAWELVEEMHRDNWIVKVVCLWADDGVNDAYAVEGYNIESCESMHTDHSPSPERAICEAYLNWKNTQAA